MFIQNARLRLGRLSQSLGDVEEKMGRVEASMGQLARQATALILEQQQQTADLLQRSQEQERFSASEATKAMDSSLKEDLSRSVAEALGVVEDILQRAEGKLEKPVYFSLSATNKGEKHE